MTFAALSVTNLEVTPEFNAEAYCQRRSRDYTSLSKDIAETPHVGNIKDLGYCQLVGACHVAVKGHVNAFKSPWQARAFILRTFW